MPVNPKIELVKAIMQIEGNLTITDTLYNYNFDGSVRFSAYTENNKRNGFFYIVLYKGQVEVINACSTVKEIYDCYKEMEYF